MYARHDLPFPHNSIIIREKKTKPQRPTLPFKVFTNSTFVALNFKAQFSHVTQPSTVHLSSLKVSIFTDLQNTYSCSLSSSSGTTMI